uniref:Protein-serine/threonine phosphatase n=1 Tax=Arcella intermedia TaxID=1963864 RepID=A0A6B2LPS1_9EUKA
MNLGSVEFYPGQFTYKTIRVADVEEAVLPLAECVEFIEEVLKMGGKVLVHCIEGRSRSGAILVAYHVKKGMSVQKALDFVRKKRFASPNTGFMKQIYAYQQC